MPVFFFFFFYIHGNWFPSVHDQSWLWLHLSVKWFGIMVHFKLSGFLFRLHENRSVSVRKALDSVVVIDSEWTAVWQDLLFLSRVMQVCRNNPFLHYRPMQMMQLNEKLNSCCPLLPSPLSPCCALFNRLEQIQMTLCCLSHHTMCNHQWLQPAVPFGFHLLYLLCAVLKYDIYQEVGLFVENPRRTNFQCVLWIKISCELLLTGNIHVSVHCTAWWISLWSYFCKTSTENINSGLYVLIRTWMALLTSCYFFNAAFFSYCRPCLRINLLNEPCCGVGWTRAFQDVVF